MGSNPIRATDAASVTLVPYVDSDPARARDAIDRTIERAGGSTTRASRLAR